MKTTTICENNVQNAFKLVNKEVLKIYRHIDYLHTCAIDTWKGKVPTYLLISPEYFKLSVAQYAMFALPGTDWCIAQ